MSLCERVAIVGVGLIGGSIGLALAERGLAERIVGIGRRAEPLAAALRRGAVHETTLDVAAGVASADLVVICTPVGRIAEDALAALAACPPRGLVTDAGSTKAAIVAQIEKQLAEAKPGETARVVAAAAVSLSGPRFLGGHPIAGNDKKGVEHARADLFVGRVTVLTPTTRTQPADCEMLTQFWQQLGAKVVQMTPDEHDRRLAAISHLPHAVSAALAAATPTDDVALAAGGWLDTTRVAGGDAVLWRQILLANAGHVLAALDRFDASLTGLRTALRQGDGDAVEEFLLQAKQVRDAVGS